ncbi:hypothetical protein Tco_0767458 [Tanacetum coccineum]
MHNNIVPKPDLALELGKSISLTKAKEEAVAREVHATHVRIVSESEPEPKFKHPPQRGQAREYPKLLSVETAMSFPPLGEEDGTEGPMIIEAKMGRHFMHRIYVDGGASSEVLYEHAS